MFANVFYAVFGVIVALSAGSVVALIPTVLILAVWDWATHKEPPR